MNERRQHRRVIANKRVWLCDFDESAPPAEPQDCLILDICEGGACIQCARCFKENQPIAFTYQDFMAEGFRPVVGVVMWRKRHSEQEWRYGIKFLGLSTQMLRRIQAIVDEPVEGADAAEG